MEGEGGDRSEVEAGTEGGAEVEEQGAGGGTEGGTEGEGTGAGAEGGEVKPKVDAGKAADKKPAELEEEPRETAARLALRQRAQALDAKEKALAERESKSKLGDQDAAELADYRQLKKNAKEDPVGWMEHGGVAPEDLFKAVKAGRAPMDPAARKALAEVEQLKKRDAERDAADKKAKDETAQRERDSKVQEGLSNFLKANAQKYELTAAKGAKGIKALQETAIAYYQKHGRMPSVDQLAATVERAYEEDFKVAAGTARGKALLVPPKKTAPAKEGEGDRKSVAGDLDTTPTAPPPRGKEKPNLRQGHSEEVRALWDEVVAERKRQEAEGNG